MTVLHVLDHSLPVMSGYSTRSRNIVVFQKAAGLRPVVVTSPKHGPAPALREERDGIPHYRTPGRRNGWVPLAREIGLMWRLARRVRDVARIERVRVIHAHSPVLNGLPALWVSRRLGIPVVYEARAFWEDAAVDHGTTREGSLRYRVTRALETFMFKRADAVVTIAQAMRQELIERGVAAERIRVAPNGVDTEWFRPVERSHALAERLGLNGGPVLGFIGSFYHYEGLRFLLGALPAVRERVPGARLLLVGGGEEDAALRAAAAPLGDAVIFAGQVPFSEVRDFYSITDVFVCPRRRMRLTELVTPLKPLEAMAMARPVVASDLGGLSELIEHDVTGVLVPAESREALVDALTRLARDAGARARIGDRAREAMIQERRWPHIIQRYVDLYGSLTGAALAGAH
ncbi:MAG TPA: TIGR04063 family PEP-CTERM/XrtA system glycosyltransferase [Methylomirabilota bacterium]|nr:TIGR04063 family PEP-CTERM/XrtA system glycosyltransferase [Methylomirabilota bacterium]